MEKGRLDGLDALRGIAALCVVAFHVWPLQAVNGYLAVDLFFMLSGYVMARTFEPRMAQGMSAGAFLRMRILRLWPTMLLGGLLCLPFFLADHGPVLWPVALANLIMIPVPMFGQAFLLNGPAWSIFFELLANGLHAAGLWRLAPVRLVLLACTMAVVLACFAAFTMDSLEVGMRTEGFLAGIPRVLLSYTLGIVLFRWWRDRPPAPVPGWIALALLPLYIAFNGWQGGYRWPLDFLFIVFGMPLAMAGALRMRNVPRWTVWLGAISFPLYAVHESVLLAGERLGVAPPVQVAAALLLAWVVARAEPALRAAVNGSIAGLGRRAFTNR